MNEERNPIREWAGAIKHETGMIAATLALGGVFLLPIFAPAFAPFIKDIMVDHYKANANLHLRPMIYKKMLWVKAVLWLIAIFTWIFVLMIAPALAYRN